MAVSRISNVDSRYFITIFFRMFYHFIYFLFWYVICSAVAISQPSQIMLGIRINKFCLIGEIKPIFLNINRSASIIYNFNCQQFCFSTKPNLKSMADSNDNITPLSKNIPNKCSGSRSPRINTYTQYYQIRCSHDDIITRIVDAYKGVVYYA